MRTNAYQKYVEDEIVMADPIKLVQLLYQGAIEAVGSARANLARGDIKARSAAATKAIEILAELAFSLNHEQGGELSTRLAALYDYMQRKLIEGNQQQIYGPFAEVEQILQTLGEAWCQVQESGMKAPASEPAHRSKVALAGADPGVPVPADYVPLSCAC